MSESRTVARRAGVVGAATLASRVLGMVRDMTVAALFPPLVTDAFFVAFTIPNTLRRLVGEGALTVAFVPVLTETLEKEGKEGARRLMAAMLGVTLLGLTVLTVVGTLASPWIVWAYGAGLSQVPGQMELTSDLTELMFCYVLFAGLLALAMGALNTLGRFFAPAFAPVLLNVCMILFAVALSGPFERLGLEPVVALAAGVVAGGLVQVAFQVPALRREGMLPRPTLDLRHPGVRTVLKLLLPAVFGVAVYQINIILSRTFASFLPTGSVTYLYYAFRLVELPQGLFIYALASAMLPSLSGFAVRGDMDGMLQAFRFATRLTVFVTLPAAVGLAVLALPVTTVLFQRGEFDATCAAQTAWALLYQAPGIVLVAGVRQVVPVFYALKDTRTPVWASVVNLVVYTALCLALMGPMLHAGISLAISLAAGAQLVVLVALLRRRLGRLGLKRILGSALRAALASALCGAAAFSVSLLGAWERGGNDPRNVLVLAAAVVAGVAVFVAAAFLLRSREIGELADAIRRRRRPT